MRFSHSVQFNAVPDWSSHYIAYSNLKKLLYTLEKTNHQAAGGDGESRPLINHEDPELVFSRALDVELEKISSFFVAKEGELADEMMQVVNDADNFDQEAADQLEAARAITNYDQRRRPRAGSASSAPDDGADDDDSGEDGDSDDENTNLNKSRSSLRRRPGSSANPMMASMHTTTDMTASTEFSRPWRRASNNMNEFSERSFLYSSGIMLKKRVVALYVQLCELKSYVQLNKTGFRKVLKKFDKTLDCSLREKYMANTVEPAYPFRVEAMTQLESRIARMEQVYADIVTKGDIKLARKDLRSHLREHVVWERNTVWRDMIGMERRAEAASLGKTLLSADTVNRRLQGDDDKAPNNTRVTTPFGTYALPSWLVSSTMVTLVLSVVAFLALLWFPIMEKPEQQNCLALLVFVSLLWATESIPLFVTSLMIPFLCVVLRVVRTEDKPHRRLSSKETTAFIFSAMWTPVIMLLLGGFALAAALSKCAIDKRLATMILSKAGTKPNSVLLANMLVAAFASMLISNVAAPVLCFSLIEPMLRTLPSDSNMSKATIMGIALSSNIGGMLSPIASPQNVVAMGIMQPAPTWLQWFLIVIPVGVVSILIIWVFLIITFSPGKNTTIAPIRTVRERFTGLQWFVSAVTVVTITLWCGSKSLEPIFGDMGVIAIIPIVLFFGIGILTKEDFNNFPWTIIILAAGGLSLGKAVKSSGLLDTVAHMVSEEVQGMSLYGVLTVFSTLILVIATFISHTVAALIILPLVFDVGQKMETPAPNLLVMAGVLMCSAAMGLPTSGFPNMTAIMKEDATGQRYLQVKHFISRGVPSSIFTLVVVLTVGYAFMLLAGLD